jgi:hypothetical protein
MRHRLARILQRSNEVSVFSLIPSWDFHLTLLFQIYRHLKPGGWFEQAEMSVVPKSDDGTVHPGNIFHKWGEVSLAAGDAFGKSLRCVDEAKQNMINAGFVEVTERRFKWPIGGMFHSFFGPQTCIRYP